MQVANQASMIYEGSTQVSFISELDDIDSLVRLYRPRVLRYVAFSIGDQDIAETITQDCFLKAYNGRASFRGDSAVSTWLFSIANNLIRDQLRTKKFQFWRKAAATSLDVTEMASFLPSEGSSAEARILAQEKAKQVASVVEKLSTNQRRVFILRFSEELDVAEIAEVTGMPVNTVKTHLRRAITTVRAKVGGRV
ncbi:RNA polymerase sigma factor [Granulicella aggregans]|uniref:RNA polymerase sigma factor n=1 Tax=Granulicella aggregans TaxID=474949 RepID=UPI0021DF47E7|nr:sigma-70 family RNA polymerase sigma factor [Granulicella aggregans]